jgi:hypothetical protein
MPIQYLKENATGFGSTNWVDKAGSNTSGFANDAQLVIPSGSASVTSDMNQSTYSLGFLKIGDRFSGNVGTATDPLNTDADSAAAEYASNEGSVSGRIEHYGTGTLYMGASGRTVSNLFQMGAGRTSCIHGTWSHIYQYQGTTTVETNAVVTKANLFGGTAIFGYKQTRGTTLNILGGSHTTLRPFQTINIYGGQLIVNCAIVDASNGSTINIYGGAVTLLAHGNTDCDITMFGGSLDIASLRYETTIATLTRYKNAIVGGRPLGAPITITNDVRKDPSISPL